MNMKKNNIKRIVLLALLSAVSFVLFLIEFPLLPSTFLKMDFSDLPAIFAGLFFGPTGVILVETAKNILQLFVKGAGSTMGFGNVMSFICGISYCLPYCYILKRNNSGFHFTFKRFVTASIISSVALVVIGFLANLLITPLYFRFFIGQVLDADYVITYTLTATLFNSLKGVILSILTSLFVKTVIKPIKKIIDN